MNEKYNLSLKSELNFTDYLKWGQKIC